MTDLPAVCHVVVRVPQSSSHVASHIRQLKKDVHTPAMVQHLHILLRLISPDKQQGVATFVFWPRYICFGSSVFLICEAGLLNVAAETLRHVTLLLLFSCCRVSTSSPIREVCICNKFSLLKRLCDHVLHPLCSFACVLLMHMTVFKLLLGQVRLLVCYWLNFVSSCFRFLVVMSIS